MLQRALMLLNACSLYASAAFAGGPIPAVDLPSVVPESVRDLTARSLASTRDRLSDAIHPFRGEFHGLGTPGGGSSYATDLSANGRVVVGAERIGNGDNQAFVWSPWTGRATYDMAPAGAEGSVIATAVSADGVYVAGEVYESRDSSAVRWSLVGREQIDSPRYSTTTPSALSENGGLVVGTDRKRSISYGSDRFFLGDLGGDGNQVPRVSGAYRYSHARGTELLGDLPGYASSIGVDVTGSGNTTLVNGNNSQGSHEYEFFSLSGGGEPFLWGADGSIRSLGHPQTPLTQLPPNGLISTTASAISADGTAVVGNVASYGYHDSYNGYFFGRAASLAVMWREGTGWIDLSASQVTDQDRGVFTSKATDVSGDGRRVLGTTKNFLHSEVIANIGIIPFVDVRTGNFLWDEQRGMRDLTDVLQLDYGLEFTGWDLGEATAISDDGTTIIGNGTNPAGEREAWRAVLQRETPHGDLDFDGDIDQFDYQTMVGNLGLTSESRSVFYADGDLNADGVVDQQDADTVLSLYEHRRWGDFNADGVVDVRDYTVWRDHLGSLGGIADANGDGRTTAADLAAWRSHYGMVIEQTLGQLIPEPSALVLLGMLGAGIAAGRRVGGQIDS